MDCVFCNIDNSSNLYETKNFYVKVGKAIITAGHVMIIPKRHYRAMGEIGNELVDEYLDLKKKVIAEITKKFAKPFLVEYGVYGQSVFHAHIHIIPTSGNGYKNVNLFKEIVLPASRELSVEPIWIREFSELQDYYKRYKMYMYFEQDGKQCIFPVNSGMMDDLPLLSYRCYFSGLGLKGIRGWQNMTEEDKENDAIKIEETISNYMRT